MAGPFVTSADVKKALAKKANQPPTTGTTGQVLTRDTSSTTGTTWQTPASGGGGSAPDATTTTNGLIRLAGDLAGTAALPTLRQLFPTSRTVGSSTESVQLTIGPSGLVTGYTTVAIAAGGGTGGGTLSVVDNGNSFTISGSAVTDNGDTFTISY